MHLKCPILSILLFYTSVSFSQMLTEIISLYILFQNSQTPLLIASTRQYSDVLKVLLGDTGDEFEMPDLVDSIIL